MNQIPCYNPECDIHHYNNTPCHLIKEKCNHPPSIREQGCMYCVSEAMSNVSSCCGAERVLYDYPKEATCSLCGGEFKSQEECTACKSSIGEEFSICSIHKENIYPSPDAETFDDGCYMKYGHSFKEGCNQYDKKFHSSPDTSDTWEEEFRNETQEYIKNLPWLNEKSEYVKTLVAGNISGFSGHIIKKLGDLPKKQFKAGQESEKERVRKVVEEKLDEIDDDIRMTKKGTIQAIFVLLSNL